jgi:hypothetical protein
MWRVFAHQMGMVDSIIPSRGVPGARLAGGFFHEVVSALRGQRTTSTAKSEKALMDQILNARYVVDDRVRKGEYDSYTGNSYVGDKQVREVGGFLYLGDDRVHTEHGIIYIGDRQVHSEGALLYVGYDLVTE